MQQCEIQVKMCDATLQFSSSSSPTLYHIKNKHPAAMSQDGSQPKIKSVMCRSESSVVMDEGFKKVSQYLELPWLNT